MRTPGTVLQLKGTKDPKQTSDIGSDKVLFYPKFHLKKLVH